MRSRISIRRCVRPSVRPSFTHELKSCCFRPKLPAVPARTHLMPCIRPSLLFDLSPFTFFCSFQIFLDCTANLPRIVWFVSTQSSYVLCMKKMIEKPCMEQNQGYCARQGTEIRIPLTEKSRFELKQNKLILFYIMCSNTYKFLRYDLYLSF